VRGSKKEKIKKERKIKVNKTALPPPYSRCWNQQKITKDHKQKKEDPSKKEGIEGGQQMQLLKRRKKEKIRKPPLPPPFGE
jgi:hypothetical protein